MMEMPESDTTVDAATQIMLNIERYYRERELKKPNVAEAVFWAVTELGEVCEVILGSIGGWVRNNPHDHPDLRSDRVREFDEQYDFCQDMGEELGDVIMMCMMAGSATGINPLAHMANKMERKLNEQQVEADDV